MKSNFKITVLIFLWLSTGGNAYARFEEFQWQDIYPGVKYLFYQTKVQGGPVRFYVVFIDLKQSHARVVVSPSEFRGKKPSEFAKSIGAQIAINGSDWNWFSFNPYGLIISSGERWPGTRDNKKYGFFAVNKSGKAWVSSSEKAVTFSLRDIYMAVPGYPLIVNEGKLGQTNNCGYPCEWNHPRTAIGVDTYGRKIFLVVADGRQQESVGISLKTLAEFMIQIGVWDALNLDGGGSSVLYIENKGGIVNKPSGHKERSVSNTLAVVLK